MPKWLEGDDLNTKYIYRKIKWKGLRNKYKVKGISMIIYGVSNKVKEEIKNFLQERFKEKSDLNVTLYNISSWQAKQKVWDHINLILILHKVSKTL